MNILTVNLIFSTVVFLIAAKIYLFPRLAELKPETVLIPILLLHSLRHLGLMFLAPGAVYPGMPAPFATPAAFGDLLAALLALAALAAVVTTSPLARLLVWIFNIEARSISRSRSCSRMSTTRRPSWVRPTGSRPSGCRACWSPITSCSWCC